MDKSKIGTPCNGCGLCCKLQVCSNGSFLLGLVDTFGERAEGPCPALVKTGEKYACGVLIHPHKYFKNRNYPNKVLIRHFAVLIGAGTGCDELGLNPTLEDEQAFDELIERLKCDEKFAERANRAIEIVYGIN